MFIYIHTYICKPRHTCPYGAIDTRIHIYIQTYAHARGKGLPTNADGAADACVRAHLYMASARAWMHKRRYRRTLYRWEYHIHARAHTLSHGIYAHGHKCTYPMHISWARACAAPAVRSQGSRYMHSCLPAYLHACIQKYIHTYTQLKTAAPAARAHAHAHAHAHAGMEPAHARIRTHTHACTAAYTHMHTHRYPVVCTSGARALTTRPTPRRRIGKAV
jgi:hypothetical protein